MTHNESRRRVFWTFIGILSDNKIRSKWICNKTKHKKWPRNKGNGLSLRKHTKTYTKTWC